MTRHHTPAGPWGRGRLLLLLAGLVTAGLVVLAGTGLVIIATLRPVVQLRPASQASPPAGSVERRDLLAAEPMLSVSDADSTGGRPAATVGPGISVPGSTVIGPARVPSGLPHTPQGAIGQLAEIEIAVLTAMNVPATGEIYQQWAMPDAPPVGSWPLLRHVQAFLAASGAGQQKDPTTTILLTPAGAQTKASDGPDWTIGCVLLRVEVTIRTTVRAGFGYCERMQWNPTDARWQIAAGVSPAPAPSTWPGTDLARQAGWLTWTTP